MTSEAQTERMLAWHPFSIIRTFWKRKWLVIVVWTLGSAVAGVVVRSLPTIYSSEALVLVDSQKIPERYVASTVSTDVQDRLATISQQILSTTHLRKIIEDFDLYRDDRKRLVEEEVLEKMREHVTIRLEKGWTGNRPGAFRIGFQGPNPATVSQVANRLAGLYIEENLRVREVQAEGTSEFITTQLAQAKRRLDELEAAVSEYKLKHLGELPEQQSAISSDLTRASLELQGNREAIRRAEESRTVLQNTLSVATATVTTLMEVESRRPAVAPGRAPAAPGLSSEAAAVRAKLDSMLVNYGQEHPDVLTLRAELGRVLEEDRRLQKISSANARQLANAPESEQLDPAVMSDARRPTVSVEGEYRLGQAQERVVSLKSGIALIDREVQTRKDAEQKLVQAIDRIQGKLGRLPIREQELARVTRDYEISKANYKTLLDKSLAAEMATDMEHRQKSERFTILDPARIPEVPTSPQRPLLAGIGSALALSLGMLLAFFREAQQGTILGEWELPKHHSILARLPDVDLMDSNPLPRNRRVGRVAVLSSAVVLVLVGMAAVYFIRL
jgi:succinoglycan biosynthesis transport protein ExoP